MRISRSSCGWLRLLCMRLGLFILSLGIALLIAEVVVRAFIPVRNIGPSFTVHDPTYGTRLKKNFSCTRITPEFTMRFTTNSMGFRGPEPASLTQRTILFIGDSFTMGYGVNDGEEFPAIVRQAVSEQLGSDRISMINAGIGATGTGRWIKFLQQQARQFTPCCVVFQICGNDFDDNIRERMYAIDDNGDIKELPTSNTPGFRRIVQRVVEAVPGLAYSRLISLFSQSRHKMQPRRISSNTSGESGDLSARLATSEDLTYLIVDRLISISQEQGWLLLAIIVDVDGERLQKLEDLFSSYNIPFILVPDKNKRPDLYYSVDGHWKATGHTFVAQLVASWLLDNRMMWDMAGMDG